jgi:Zn-dependent metalloprotease
MKAIDQDQQKLLDELKLGDKSLESLWSDEMGLFKEMRGALAKLHSRQTPATLALKFVTKFDRLFGPKATDKSYSVFRDIKTKDGGTKISINYQVDNLIVLGGRINVYFDNEGTLRKVDSSLPKEVVLRGETIINEESLYNLLMEKFTSHPDSESYIKEQKNQAAGTSAFIFPATSQPMQVLRRVDNGSYHPTWMGLAILPVEMELPGGEKQTTLTQAEYYVDATNGEFLKTEATIEFADVAVNVPGRAVIRDNGNLVTVTTRGIQRDGGDYYLKNTGKDIDIITFDANGNNVDTVAELRDGTMDMCQDADGDWSESTSSCAAADRSASQQPEIDLHRFATQIYEYYENLGWKGFDNEGWDTCPVRAVAHIGLDANAYFNKFSMTGTGNMYGFIAFYDGECDSGSLQYDFIAGDLGIVAHEYQHAITYFGVIKSNGDPGGLYSDTIRGAMREGYSDTFAGLISGIWTNPALAPDGVCAAGRPFRRMEYPRSSDIKPPSWNGTYCDHYEEIGDVNNKYFKSTILSHTAFLVAEGGVHDRSSRSPQYIPVPPVGAEATARIWLTALTEKLDGLAAGGGDQRMVDVANYLLDAAQDEYGRRSEEYVLLRRALYAVGLYPFNTTASPYQKALYGGEACMMPWGWSWRRSQEYLSLPMFRHWQSMDLFIDNGSGITYEAVIGRENSVFARMRNIGDQDLNDVTVELWYRKVGANVPLNDRDWKRCKDSSASDCTKIIPLLPAGSSTFEDTYTDADAVKWFLDPEEVNGEIDHVSLKATILCDAPNHDNDYESSVHSNVQHVQVGLVGSAIIRARVRWNETGIWLEQGKTYQFSATGQWSDGIIRTGPDGYRLWPLIIAEGLRRAPESNWFALIGTIGRTEATRFLIGSETIYVPPESGYLFCFANNAPWFYWNNFGQIVLEVREV